MREDGWRWGARGPADRRAYARVVAEAYLDGGGILGMGVFVPVRDRTMAGVSVIACLACVCVRALCRQCQSAVRCLDVRALYFFVPFCSAFARVRYVFVSIYNAFVRAHPCMFTFVSTCGAFVACFLRVYR